MIKIAFIFLVDIYLVIGGLLMIDGYVQLALLIVTLVFLLLFTNTIKRITVYRVKQSQGQKHMLKYLLKPFVNLYQTIVNDSRVPGFRTWPASRFIIQFILPTAGFVAGVSAIIFAYKDQLMWNDISPLLFHLTTLYILAAVLVEPVFQFFRSRSAVVLLRSVENNLMIKLVYLFLFIFTFLTPVGWLLIFFLVLIQAISKVKAERAGVIH